jgi:hypothetical protein
MCLLCSSTEPHAEKRVKWKWTANLKQVFAALRAQFANSIHLIHPNDDLSYSIYTDASKFAVGALLVQADENGETYIVSTASSGLTATEQKY